MNRVIVLALPRQRLQSETSVLGTRLSLSTLVSDLWKPDEGL